MANPLPSDTSPAAPPDAPDPTAYYTGDMVRALNAANPLLSPRYETVYGELLVSPSPRYAHQHLAFEMARRLADYADRFGVGKVLMSPADISFGRHDVVAQPDVFVLAAEVARATRASNQWVDARTLLLACEVLSPSTARADRFTKRRLYQQHGVPLYWIVDAERARVEVFTPADDFPRFEAERLVWRPEGAAEPFVLELAALFASG